jgi:two-component system cell cycle response regulator
MQTAATSPVQSQAAAQGAVLKLLVMGFSVMERRLLDGAVMLSQRRAPRIDLVADADAAQADVVLIDALHPQCATWAAGQPWLQSKPAIWAGAKVTQPNHLAVERHIKWPILPVLLYRAIEQAQGPVAPRAAAQGVKDTGRKVLVVDDSLAARIALRSMLEPMGIEITEAATAEDGIAAASRGGFACAFLDVLMPGMDGFEACRRIKARTPQLPVVMLTSKSSPFDRVRGKIAGCDTYITKPVDAAQLRDVVGRHLALTTAARLLPAAPAFAPALRNANA